MKLIDADKIPYVQDVTYMKDYDYAYRYAIEAEPTVEAIPVEHVEKMIESVKSLPNVDYSLKYFAVNVMDALISGWKVEQEKQNEKT